MTVPACFAYATSRSISSAGGAGHLEPQCVAELLDGDQRADRRGEAGDHGKGDELDRTAEPRKAEDQQDDTGHERGREEPVHSVSLHDPVDDHHEGAGGPTDLHPRAAERRDQKACDDGGVEAAVGRDAAGDGEGDRERERHHPDDHPGNDVGGELLASVGPEGGDELGD